MRISQCSGMVSLKVDATFDEDHVVWQLWSLSKSRDKGLSIDGSNNRFDRVVDAGSDEALVPCCYQWIF